MTVMPLLGAVIYCVAFYINPDNILQKMLKVPELLCLLYASFLEMLILSHLIPANDNYKELWGAASIGAGIMSQDGELCYKSRKSIPVTKEQEIFNAKIRIHDDVGRSLLAARAYLSGKGGKKDKESLMLLWKATISVLKKEAEPEKKNSTWEQLQKAAESVQVRIVLGGSLPEEEKAGNILITAMYECLTNTVKLADGTEVYISIIEDDRKIKMQATNNGNPPEKVVEETGGLSNLRRIVEENKGQMVIESLPRFELRLELPKGVENV